MDPFSHLDSNTDPFAHLDNIAAAKAETGNWSSKLGRFAQGAAEPIIGTAQLASHLTGVGTGWIDRKAKAAEDFYQKSRVAAGIAPEDWDYWAGAGNIASPINVLPGGAAARAGALAGRAGLGGLGRAAVEGATAGGLGGLTQPVTTGGDYGEAKEGQALAGAAFGAALGPAARIAAGSAVPAVAPEARTLANADLTIGQLGGPGSWIKRLEDVGEKAPIVGGSIRAARERSVEGFNRTAYDWALDPVKKTVPTGTEPGHAMFVKAEGLLSDEYNKIHPKVSLVQDNQLAQDLLDVFSKHETDLVDSRQKQLLSFIDKKITNRIADHGGTIDGAEVQKITSELAHKGREWMRASDPDAKALGLAYRDVREVLNDAIERQNPAHAPQLQALNQAWSRLMVIEPAVASTASAARGGLFTPTQFELGVKAGAGKRQMARGTAQGQELAEAGKKLLPANIASSGTEERRSTMEALGALAGGHFGGLPGLLAMATIPVLYSEPGQRVARNLMMRSPQQAQYINQLLQRYAPTAAGLGVAANQ
jgi:hypothetical protein